MDYLAIASMILGGIGLCLSGIVVYRTRRDWERRWAKRGQEIKLPYTPGRRRASHVD